MSGVAGGDRAAQSREPAGPGVQEALLASDPVRFYYPPYVGHRGWLGVRLDVAGVDWAEIGELVVGAYRVINPKRLDSTE